MAPRDDRPRLSPYEMLFPETSFPDDRFPAIDEEARERGVDTGNPAAFVMLGSVQGILADLRADDAAAETAHDHGGVLYFAYRMWRAGPSVASVPAGTLRELLAARPARPPQSDDWTAALSEQAGYIRLPRHLLWLEEGEAGEPGDRNAPDPPASHAAEPAGYEGTPGALSPPPESVDGLFWAADGAGAINLALVTGVRPDRPGYGIVPVPPQPLSALPEWAAGPAREGGGDFTTSLPGAELDGLFGIRTPAEVFKLAAVLLRHLALP